MCLILLAVNPDDRYRLVVAANRDELYARPSRPAAFRAEAPDLLAGRDEAMGGTWLGVNRRGCFAAVTNFMEAPPAPLPPRSRGDLTAGFLRGRQAPRQYLEAVSQRGREYRGFNLIVADNDGCHYYSNRAGQPCELTAGCYGLSNRLLDCDWPKVVEGRGKLAKLLASGADDLTGALFALLLHEGDGREFSNSFISSDAYGTRAVTVVLIEHTGRVLFEERNFGARGAPLRVGRFDFTCSAGS